jgi:hypothetical protein
VSVPWGSPGADPLADIRKFMRNAEQEYRASLAPQPLLVAAPNLREAQLGAQQAGLHPGQWRYVQGPAGLLGYRGPAVMVVNVHRMRVPATWDAEMRVMKLTGTTVRYVRT